MHTHAKCALVLAALLCGTPSAWARGEPEPDAPRWWRGNLHAHTFWSDGNDYPEMVSDWYAAHGYNFLAISDHNVMQQGVTYRKLADLEKRARGKAFAKYLARFGPAWVETRGEGDAKEVRLKPFDEYRMLLERAGSFIMMPSEEITTETGGKQTLHINATNLVEVIQPPKGATVVDVLRQASAAAREQAARTKREIMIHVNHPNYKWGVTAEDLAQVTDERFFEIWNGVDGDGDPGDGTHPSTDEVWDIANTLRIAGFRAPPLLGIATDDSHDYHGDVPRAMPGRAWVMVRSRFLTPEHVIRGLRAGDFYASTGVQLEDVSFDGAKRVLSLRIAPSGSETFVTRFVGTRAGANLKGVPRKDEKGQVVETTLDYTGDGPRIGEVLAEVPGLAPTYALRGDELYVRAVVESTGASEFPSKESRRKKAWTQPVGWERHLAGG